MSDADAHLRQFVSSVTGADPQHARVQTLMGDASTRRYHRVQGSGTPPQVVVMELPAGGGPTSPSPSPPLPGDELPFLNVHRFLAGRGYPVPAVHQADLSRGLIALEDLGDATLASVVDRNPQLRRPLYAKAIALIVELQRLGRNAADPGCYAFSRRFDEALLRWELDHFREWLLEADRRIRLTDAERADMDAAFGRLAAALAGAPPVLVHRDFQSRNLMVVGDGETARLAVIDFQDALLGPAVYDLVALLRDSYVQLPEDEVNELLASYADAAGVINRQELRAQFNRQTLQRKLKDAGRFIYLDRVRKNPSFLQWMPTTMSYVKGALEAVPEAAGLHDILRRHVRELR